MEKIDEIEYKGFKTEFYVTKKVKEYLEKNNINLDNLKQKRDSDTKDYSFFYEVLLFEEIDEDGDGIPDKKFGKNFKLIYYEIIKRKNKYDDDFEYEILEKFKEEFKHDENKVLSEGSDVIDFDNEIKLEIKYKILMG